MIIIYVLKKDNIPFYVGKCININVRFNQHKFTYGDDIKIEIIELVKTDEWKKWEKYYINLYKDKGYILLNKNNGTWLVDRCGI